MISLELAAKYEIVHPRSRKKILNWLWKFENWVFVMNIDRLKNYREKLITVQNIGQRVYKIQACLRKKMNFLKIWNFFGELSTLRTENNVQLFFCTLRILSESSNSWRKCKCKNRLLDIIRVHVKSFQVQPRSPVKLTVSWLFWITYINFVHSNFSTVTVNNITRITVKTSTIAPSF